MIDHAYEKGGLSNIYPSSWILLFKALAAIKYSLTCNKDDTAYDCEFN